MVYAAGIPDNVWGVEGIIPAVIQNLCLGENEIKFAAEDGYQAFFRGRAGFAFKYKENIWMVKESSVSENGIFYFDAEGNFMDICQVLFRSDVCQKYKNLICDTKNYCLQ